MVIVIYIMLAIVLVAVVYAVVMLARRKGPPAGADKFDVLYFSGTQLTVLAGVPVTYEIADIERVVFSVVRGRRSSNYVGTLRIIKTNGKKSRPFIFDSSRLAKKFVLSNSRQDIVDTARQLMAELKANGIPSANTLAG